MTDSRRAMEIFSEVVDLDPAARSARLDELCGDDADLRAQVERMLAADAEGSLGEVVRGVLGADRPSERLVGATIGPYKLLKCLGEGGFGVVYLAEQREPVHRRVALKLIKPELLRNEDASSVTARFELERETLKVLAHEHIARIYDAGATERGVPYFAMEYVAGDPITTFCDEHKLGIEARIRLFRKVCLAVQHAHNNGIIHRDLSPSNVLVAMEDGEPVPKVIDFGVAKAVNPEMVGIWTGTITGQVIGKLEYMSPEQAKNPRSGVDIRSDVYALGVLLYELLTGVRPFDLKAEALQRVVQVIDRVDPPTPSSKLETLSTQDAARLQEIARSRQLNAQSLERTLRRELEWIPLMAMRKEPERRYRNAGDLADDLQAYLAGEVLQAGPESRWYRIGKVLKRYRWPVTAATAIVLLLTAGVVTTSTLLDRAIDAESTTTSLLDDQRRLTQSESRARLEAEALAYLSGIQVSELLAAQGQWVTVRERLGHCVPTRRDWEWGWLYSSAHQGDHILEGHSGDIRSVSFSPDQTRILTGSRDGTARLWNIATGTHERTYRIRPDHSELPSAIWDVDFSRDGRTVAAASDVIIVWDTASAETILQLEDKLLPAFARVRFVGRDSRLVTTSPMYEAAHLWDANSGVEITMLTEFLKGNCIATSPDGMQFVVSSKNEIILWDATGEEPRQKLIGHLASVVEASFSPNGTLLATADADGNIRVWDLRSGSSLHNLGPMTGTAISLAFSADSRRVLATSINGGISAWDLASPDTPIEFAVDERRVRAAFLGNTPYRVVSWSESGPLTLWDADSGGLIHQLVGHQSAVTDVAVSQDSGVLVSASEDRTAIVWNMNELSSQARIDRGDWSIESLSFSADGSVCVGHPYWNAPKLWDARTGYLLKELEVSRGNIEHMRISPDGARVLAVDASGRLQVWDAGSGERIVNQIAHSGAASHGAFSPDGTLLATASWDQTAAVWQSSDGELVVRLENGHSDAVNLVEFSPSGNLIATGGFDNRVILWNTESGQIHKTLVHNESRSIIRDLAFDATGSRIVSVSDDGTVNVWNTYDGSQVTTLGDHELAAYAIAWSPDGQRVATASLDSTARVWDATTGECLLVLRGHTREVVDIEFNASGSRVVTASWDNTARVWDAESGNPLVTLQGQRLEAGRVSLRWASFTPDGTIIYTTDNHGHVKRFDSIPPRVRRAERRRYENGGDGSEIIESWLEAVRNGTEGEFFVPLN